MTTCKRDHVAELPAEFDTLPESQAARWRHRCAACAYTLGRRHADQAEQRLRSRVRELTAVVQELRNGRPRQ